MLEKANILFTFDCIAAEKFAIIKTTNNGHLAQVIEKPSAEQIAECGIDPMLSMNCWAFDQSIFAACAKIKPSPRGELELPDAVANSMADGTSFMKSVYTCLYHWFD